MTRHSATAAVLIALFGGMSPVAAQQPARGRPQAAARAFEIGGYGTVGRLNLTAADTFEAVLGKHAGPILGGGITIGLPLGGLYVEAGAWRFKEDGQRVFLAGGQVFELGVPLTVTLTPIEVTAGWRFRQRGARIVPYAGAGITSTRYREAAGFAGAGDDVDERFSGYHFIGGVQLKIRRWLGFGGEVVWTTTPDALGTGGVSRAFGDDDLGGTSVRGKITIGR